MIFTQEFIEKMASITKGISDLTLRVMQKHDNLETVIALEQSLNELHEHLNSLFQSLPHEDKFPCPEMLLAQVLIA